MILAAEANAGEISVDVELENPVDRGIFERGLDEESSVRRTRAQGMVDTGARPGSPLAVGNHFGHAGQRTRRQQHRCNVPQTFRALVRQAT